MAAFPSDSGESKYFNGLIVLASRKHGLAANHRQTANYLSTRAECMRAASGVPAPGHEPVEDDQLLRRGRLFVAGHGGDEIQLPARQRPIALKAEVTGPAPIGELLRGWIPDVWRVDGTKSSSHVKPTFLRIFSACRAA